MIVKSYAKINSILCVLRKRSDGYHEIFSVMHKISLSDTIYLRKNKGGIRIFTSVDELNTPDNLAFRAAGLFFERSGIKPQVDIEIEKHIPVGGGLGGGSSNAAYTLRGLNEMFGHVFEEKELLEMASFLGSDVAFFIVDGSAIARGRGELVERINCDYESNRVLLVVPDFSISTEYVYKKFRLTKGGYVNKMPLAAWSDCKMSSLKRIMCNDLESVVLEEFDLLKRLKIRLTESVGNGLVSGSGSSIFSIIDAEVLQEGLGLKDRLKGEGFWCEMFDFV